MKALCKVRLPSRSKKELGIASPSLLVIVIIIQSASTTTGTSSAEAQPCFQPVNNIQIFTPNKSSTPHHGMDANTTKQLLAVMEVNNAHLISVMEQLQKNNEHLANIIQLLNRTQPPEWQGGPSGPPSTDHLSREQSGFPRDCLDVQRAGFIESGQYKVFPDDGEDPFFVFCDMETDGGGWTVFQRRLDGSVDFYHGWAEYKEGFGNLLGEHWLGNEKLHRLTSSNKNYILRVEVEDWNKTRIYAEYDSFVISSEQHFYRISFGNSSGKAAASLRDNNGMFFSTHDADHDSWSANCAATYSYHSAWWYHSCTYSNLNGIYLSESEAKLSYGNGIMWYMWKGNVSMRKAEMKFRPV